MSKQSENKINQGYQKTAPKCAGCLYFTSDSVTISFPGYPDWQEERNSRCSLGGFSVLKRGWCKKHEEAAK